MKTPKDRLQRVLVIGATPAGMAATNKLGEMGIPVTLVDSDPDLDRKLSRRRLSSHFGSYLELCPSSRNSANLEKSSNPLRVTRSGPSLSSTHRRDFPPG